MARSLLRLERAHRPGPSRFEVKCAYRADAIVEDRLLLELKAIERILPIHHQQTLTYLKLSQLRQGLLINFNSKRLVDGVKRFLL